VIKTEYSESLHSKKNAGLF